MNFEARMRKVISKTLDPVVKQAQTDGKTLFKIDTQNKKLEDRLKLLEAAVFKTDKEGTLFEVFEERLIQMDVSMRAE